jgi:hypothetical protein
LSLVEIAVLHDVALAEILRGRLASDGLHAVLFDSGFAGLLGGGYPGIRLMVAGEDAAAARRLLNLPENEADHSDD